MVRSVKCLVNLVNEMNASPRDATTKCHRGGIDTHRFVVVVVGFLMCLYFF